VISFSTLNQLNIFGEYGYTLIYFVGGALFADIQRRQGESLMHRLGKAFYPLLIAVLVLSWFLLFATQRYQAANFGVVFYVKGGYWNLFALIIVMVVFYLLSNATIVNVRVRSMLSVIGSNTLGIYFLHMFFLVACSLLLSPFVSTLPFALNVILMLIIYFLCFAVSWLGTKIPGVRLLFKL
jgi:surface polysaccharide O-acyltransferase-like enzyme